MTSSSSQQLVRKVWRSVPLSKLKRLTLKSDIPFNNNKKDTNKFTLKLKPEWREDASIKLVQTFIITSASPHSNTKNADSTSATDDDDTVSPAPATIRSIHDIHELQMNVNEKNNEGDDIHVDLSYKDNNNKYNRSDDELLLPEESVMVVKFPQTIDSLSAHLQSGSIIQKEGSKIEAMHSIQMSTKDGIMSLGKLRAEIIQLTNSSSQHPICGKVLEAQTLDVESMNRIRLRQVHGSQIKLQCKNTEFNNNIREYNKKLDDDDTLASIDISSLYTSGDDSIAVISTNQNARVKYSHGHVCVHAVHNHHQEMIENYDRSSSSTVSSSSSLDEYGQPRAIVKLDGVNGSCDVTVTQNKPHCSFIDTTTTTAISGESSILAAKIHFDSLSPGSISPIISESSGKIVLTTDRKLESDVRLVSGNDVEKIDINVLISNEESGDLRNTLDELDGQNELAGVTKYTGSIDIKTNSFSETPTEENSNKFKTLSLVNGQLSNLSNEKMSRFDAQTLSGGSIGKVNLSGAASQALHGFGSSSSSGDKPLILAASRGSLTLETLSWKGAIARRYGMEKKMLNK